MSVYLGNPLKKSEYYFYQSQYILNNSPKKDSYWI